VIFDSEAGRHYPRRGNSLESIDFSFRIASEPDGSAAGGQAMAKLEKNAILAAVPYLLAALWAPLPASAAECIRKTAGFYLEEMDQSAPRSLSRSLQNLPASLTGLPGNVNLGRDVFISSQKGGCVNCHQLSSLSPQTPQGTIGPALDGAGARYSDGQLRQVLLQPKSYFPETIMPSYYQAGAAGDSVLTAAEIEDLVAYLRTLK
jgi:L-cysteine S-thiosulfotransferase